MVAERSVVFGREVVRFLGEIRSEYSGMSSDK